MNDPYQNKDRGRFFWGCLFLFLAAFPAASQAKEELTLEEIAKTPAARYFISKQYPESLTAFLILEAEHPQSGIVKRYLASLYEKLNQPERALEKLEEAIQLEPADAIARQMMAESYIKQGKFEPAKEQLEEILKGPPGPVALYAKKRLATLEQTMGQGTIEGKQLAIKDFMASEPAQFFAKGDYSSALQGFEQLHERYPEDLLVLRFQAIALMRLKRDEEARQMLEAGLQQAPEHVALHFYLGQVDLALEKMEEARKEFRWVMEQDEGSYRIRAQQAMFQSLKGAKPAAAKPWSFSASGAYDFDTNATFKSSDREYSTAGDQNSGKYSNTLVGTYRFYQKGRWFFTGDGLYAQTLYNDFPHLNTYTPGAGISALYGFSFFKRAAFLNLREGSTVTYLKNKLYVWSNTVSGSFIYNIHPRYRSTWTYRFGYNEYENNGLTPDTTSRDGFSHAVSFLNNHYLSEDKTFYWTHGYDFERHDTSGLNYLKLVHIGRLSIHRTLFEKVEGDIGYVFKDSNFYKFASTPPRRRDDVHTLTITLSRPLTQLLTLAASYIFEDSRAKNNAYEYGRHVFGAKLTLKL